MIAIDQTGEGPPLVLLHGVGANRAIWRRVTPPLAEHRRVIAPDLPGFGESDAAASGFDLSAVAWALADVLADYADEPFDLLGNSLGGAIAVALAFERPELVRRLVLAAPAGFASRSPSIAAAAGALAGRAVTARRIIGAPAVRSGPARRALLWGTVAEPQRLSDDDARMMVRASRGSTRIGAAVAAVLRADLRSQLAGVAAPVGLIWGWRDRIVPIATLRTIRAVRPDAAVATIPRAAHVPQVERPDEFVTALNSVLGRLST